MKLGKVFYMKVVEERKIYNFAEGITEKKWADLEEIDGTVTAAETLISSKTEFELD